MTDVRAGAVYILRTDGPTTNPRVLVRAVEETTATVRLLDTYEHGVAGEEFPTPLLDLTRLTEDA